MQATRGRFSHLTAVLQAFFVTFLWSTSWVLIKIGLQDIPALTFAGLRYVLAFLCLLPFVLRPAERASLRGLSRRGWGRLILLGVLYYAVTQGAQFLGLSYLPAMTTSLLLSFTTAVVALLELPFAEERPTLVQWAGVAINTAGVLIYFYPPVLESSQVFGVLIVLIAVLANAFSSILGRRINRQGTLSPLVVTAVSMGVGSILMLATGVLTEGIFIIEPLHILIIGWLAVANTALAFTLWNHTLRTLSATESSIINNTMLIQIALLAWLFLGEGLSGWEVVGMVLAGVGALVAQIRRRADSEKVTE